MIIIGNGCLKEAGTYSTFEVFPGHLRDVGAFSNFDDIPKSFFV